MLRIKVIIGSTRQNRFGEKPARWIFEELKKRPDVEAELVDLRDYPLPFFDEPKSPAMAKGTYTNTAVIKWAKKVAEGDGFIIVSPEYNHGYPAVLKNALDYVYYEWNCKPVGFVSYGGVGGARVIEQLRLVAVELQMVPIRSAVNIANFWQLLDENGNFKAESLTPFAAKFLDDLLWWASLTKIGRETPQTQALT